MSKVVSLANNTMMGRYVYYIGLVRAQWFSCKRGRSLNPGEQREMSTWIANKHSAFLPLKIDPI